jgi:large subunit ribosomal protein L4
LKGLGLENKKSVFVLPNSNKNVYLSSRNLKRTKALNSSELNTYTVMNAGKLVISESCLGQIESNFTK